MEISVIIPVYNVQMYIDDMLESVLEQTLKRSDFEVILIDDKSTDKSFEKINNYKEKVDIILQNDTNIGLGATRNKGLDISQGKYVMFLDSDDIIKKDALEKMLKKIKEQKAQIVQGAYERFNSRWSSFCVNQQLFQKDMATTLNQNPELLFELTAWNKLYDKSYLQSINFRWEEGRLYEDMFPNTKALIKAPKIYILKDVVYMWRVREKNNSITQKKVEFRNLKDRFIMLEMMYNYLLEQKVNKKVMDILEQRIYIDFSYYFEEIDQMDNRTKEYLNKKVIAFLKKLNTKNLEQFNGYRKITKKVEKRRYVLIKEVLEKDIFDIISHNKFTIIIDDEKYLKDLDEMDNKFYEWCQIYYISDTKKTFKKVRVVSSFEKIDNLINTFIIYNNQYRGQKFLNYIDQILGKRQINILEFNRQKKFKTKEYIGEIQEEYIPIFLSCQNREKSLEDLYIQSTKGKNSIFYHSNILYKNSKLLLKYKNSKFVYNIYKIFK